jgi:3-deoxy-D-manno-octulosonic-acid transferase
MVKSEAEFVNTCLDILLHKERAEQMKHSCVEVVQENQGATKKNLLELQHLLDEQRR